MKSKILIYFFAIFLFGCGEEKPSELIPTRPSGEARKQVETKAVSRELQQAIRITTSDYYDCSPSWSPDGIRIAYAEYRKGAQNIWVVEITTGEDKLVPAGKPVQITTGIFVDETPSWSPDGERIVFSSNRNGKSGLFIVELSDNKIINLEQEGIYPRWSPQGDEIVFVDMNNIWTMELSNKKSRRYLTASGYNEFPCWSQDAEQIVFFSDGGLIMINKDGSMRTPLTSSGWNNQPDWCLEKERIVFVSNRGEYYDLWKIKPDGTGLAQLTDGPGQESSPTCSPDGKWAAFQADYEGSFDIWAIPAE